MLFGLGLGLIVALGVYLRDARPPTARPTAGQPAEQSQPRAAAVSERARAPAPAPATQPESNEPRFDFYDMLTRSEVVVPEVETETGRNAAGRAIDDPGKYVLQVGSFTSLADADRLQANLALLGIESRIQRVEIDDDVFHRVRVGPISDLAAVNRIRAQLRGARIEPLVMKVPN